VRHRDALETTDDERGAARRLPDMPDTIDERLRAVREAEAAGDPERLDQARQAYLEVDETGPVAAEMRYRLGLARLFRHQDQAGAIELFKLAANEKRAQVAAEARISLALCLHGQKKTKQAIFEIKKMLPEGVRPSIHTAQALDFLSLLLRESGAAAPEIIACDKQRIEHLNALANAAADPVEKAHYMLRIAAAHADGGTGPDLALARKKYDEILKLGPKAGESALAAARAALKVLPR
jgi:tetratricopeptide (TPR) repeat protein